MSCRFAHDDAAYVLGALSPAERRAYEDHLAGCAACTRAVQEIAGLPGLLSRCSAAAVIPEPVEVPDTLLPRLIGAVEHRRRRRRLVLVGSAAAAVAGAAVLGGLAVRGVTPASSTSDPIAAATLAPVGGAPIEATASVASLPWGTAVDLHCTYHGDYGSGAAYTLVAVSRSGAVDELATWDARPGDSTQVTGATAWQRSEIASLQIRTPSGTPVMRLDD
jgi:hypothetical protein